MGKSSRYPLYYLHRSNALTYGSLLAGLLAVMAAGGSGSWNIAGGLLALCALLDTFDGKYAGRFDRSQDRKAFGIELDSLADAVVFGLVPVICIYLLTDFKGSLLMPILWLAAAMVYLVGALTRLGCYNVHQSGSDSFIGVPTTLAALALSTVFLSRPAAITSTVSLIVLALLMVAPITIPRPRGLGMAAFVASIMLVLILHMKGAV